MNEEDLVRLFWGKSRGGVHPALFHMVDVGMVARAMVERSQAAALRGLLQTDERTIGFGVALHDLGKICPGFQHKEPELSRLAKEHGFELPTRDGDRRFVTDHTRGTYHRLRSTGPPQLNDPRQTLARSLAAHHGAFPPANQEGATGLGGARWAAACQAAIVALAETFEVDAEVALNVAAMGPAAAMVLAGLTAVCDWIGSDTGFFPPAGTEPPTLARYAEQASRNANRALDELGWDAWQPDDRTVDFGDLFPFAPNQLQQEAVCLVNKLHGPACVIIEAPMGCGKTEAALYLADRLLATNTHTGIYYALPTQATSNSMFQRFKRYVEQRHAGRPNLHLLHGLAAYDETYEALLDADRRRPRPGDVGDQPEESVVAASWFRGAKLGLLSPFAVGTIDQALLGALQSRHMFVRLYGLAGKVVVLDEVHAYDTYTTCLIERLIEWLHELRCSVVLLSATLPRTKRESLLAAWGGATVKDWGDYPRLTVVTDTPAEAIPVPTEPSPPFRLAPLRQDGEWHEVVLGHLAERLAGGGCAAWLCNTVGRAQEAYLRLKADKRFADTEVHLFHARFPVLQRYELEQQVLRLFGKPDESGESPHRPRKAVLVATQVVEQSLDLDFDVMVTDPAPIDLLLQRAGRVHRHTRDRPERLREGVVYWLEPPSLEHTFDHVDEAAWVYEPWVLLKTQIVLGEGAKVAGPGEIERLVARVYDHEPEVPAVLRAAAECARTKYLNALTADAHTARTYALPRVTAEDPFGTGVAMPGDDLADPSLPIEALRAVTRLGDPSLVLVLARPADGATLEFPDGTRVTVGRPPSADEERRLVGASVRVQRWDLFEYYSRRTVPDWDASAPLRHYRLARFGPDWCSTEGPSIRLSRNLGLVISREVMELLG